MAVGHRVVHGGSRFREPVVVDDEVAARARRALVARAAAQRGRRSTRSRGRERALPDVPHVAVFDTAFHATIPPEASTYALPRALARAWGDPPLRLPRARGRSGSRSALRGAATRRLPPRRRLLGHGRPRRPLGRHDHGLHPARGRPDGDPLGLGRPGRAPPRPARARPVGRGARPRARARVGSRCPRRVSTSRSASTSSRTASPRRSPRWRPRSAGSTCSRSRAGSARTGADVRAAIAERLAFARRLSRRGRPGAGGARDRAGGAPPARPGLTRTLPAAFPREGIGPRADGGRARVSDSVR